MTDTPPDRDAIRKRARARALQMGVPVRPESAATDSPVPEPVPTTRPHALRALLNGGHLTAGQAESARRLFAYASQYVNDHPEDAA